MNQRIGVYGGTFDPIHLGHLVIAEFAREQFDLEQVLFVPSGNPPHKSKERITSPRQRLEMVQLAVAGNARFAVCDYEVCRDSISYTVQTLQHLKQTHPGAELYLILGADNLRELPNWHQPDAIAELAHLCFAARPGSELDFSMLNGVIAGSRAQDARTHQLATPLLEISSSDIRRRAANGNTIRYLVPAPVHAYIEAEGLYQANSPAR